MLRDGDTIFALSSGAGKAGIAVVRVSGSQAGTALKALTGRPLPEPRHAVLAPLREPDFRAGAIKRIETHGGRIAGG